MGRRIQGIDSEEGQKGDPQKQETQGRRIIQLKPKHPERVPIIKVQANKGKSRVQPNNLWHHHQLKWTRENPTPQKGPNKKKDNIT